jgi:hypothetical protein
MPASAKQRIQAVSHTSQRNIGASEPEGTFSTYEGADGWLAVAVAVDVAVAHPGMIGLKSLRSNARLNPLAKNPPNGATVDAKTARTIACTCIGRTS